jgi:hypothetical protein
MNSINSKLASLKCHSLIEAVSKAIPIESSQSGLIVAHLIPVGDWILGRTSLIKSAAELRNKHMKSSLTQFEANLANTTQYFESRAFSNSPCISFIIADKNFKKFGFIGFSNIFREMAELDNILIDEKIMGSNFRLDVELQAIEWLRGYLNINKIFLKVLSFNQSEISLHHQCGFTIERIESLKRVFLDDKIKFEICDPDEADLDFSCMTMSRSFFEHGMGKYSL